MIKLFYLIICFRRVRSEIFRRRLQHRNAARRETSASAMQRGTLNDPHLRPHTLGLTRATNTQPVMFQQKTRPVETRPVLRWKRELSVWRERCGPNWQRNTQAVGRSQIRCTHTTLTSTTELGLFWDSLKMRFCLVFLVSSFNSPRQYIPYEIQFALNTAWREKIRSAQMFHSLEILSSVEVCSNFDVVDLTPGLRSHYRHWSSCSLTRSSTQYASFNDWQVITYPTPNSKQPQKSEPLSK